MSATRAAAITLLTGLSFMLPAAVLAKPVVVIALSQATVTTGSDGNAHLTPLAGGVALGRGTVIRYTISAKDTGADPAQRLVLTGHIPAGTAFAPGSLHGPGGHAEFSLDGATFSEHPMVAQSTPSGTVMVPADPALYVLVRWTKDAPLAAQGATAFSYDVRLK